MSWIGLIGEGLSQAAEAAKPVLSGAADVAYNIGNIAGDVSKIAFDGGGLDLFSKMTSLFDTASAGEVADISTRVADAGQTMGVNAGNFGSLANSIITTGAAGGGASADAAGGLLGSTSSWLENPATRAGLGHAARALIEDRQIDKIAKARLKQIEKQKAFQGHYYVAPNQ